MSGSYTHLRKDLIEPGEIPIWPKLIKPAPFDAGEHARGAHQLLLASYEHGGGHVSAFDVWWQALRTDPEYDPASVFLAQGPDGCLVGVSQCWNGGFLKDLAVAPSWRRKGVGRALLLTSFCHFHRKGFRHLDLKVENDNPTCAQDLYRSVGMYPVS